MGKKRLIIEVEDWEYEGLLEEARSMRKTMANLVRQSLGLTLKRQGVKSEQPLPKKRARASAEKKTDKGD